MRSLLVVFICISLAYNVFTTGSVDAKSIAAEKLDTADQAFRDRNWPEAVSAYRVLIAENPYNGEFCYRLGAALYALKEYRASAEAYAKAVDLGYQKGGSLYNMGCDYALIGEKDKAIDAIERAIASGLRSRERLVREDSDLDSIRDSEAFRTRIMPAVGDDTSRVDGWRMDLDYLTLRMEATHYDVYRNITRQEWDEAIKRLSNRIDGLEDHEIVVEIMKLVTRVGDGHTRVSTANLDFHAIPVRFYVFEDGVFIRSASDEYKDAVGRRVVRVGELPVEEALIRVATVTQRDNPMQIKWIAPRYMAIVEILDALGVNEGLDHVDVTVSDEKGHESTVRFVPVALDEDVFHERAERVSMREETNVLPLWQKRKHDLYWYE